MSATGLTCPQTPLRFPSGISLNELEEKTDSTIEIHSSVSGSLQPVSRRTGGGAGDGVNIEENSGLMVDYKGQQYSYVEAIFHAPGLHVFPDLSETYPAEYHIHLKTYATPVRKITIVIPLKIVTGDISGHPYFMACRATPVDNRPLITTLFTPGTTTLQYKAPDIRGRTRNVAETAICRSVNDETVFILVLTPNYIRATDIDRINRLDTGTSDPRNLPVAAVIPSITLTRQDVLNNLIIANPGVGSMKAPPAALPKYAAEDEIDSESSVNNVSNSNRALCAILFTLCFVVTITALDFVLGFVWSSIFNSSDSTDATKMFIMGTICIAAFFSYDGLMQNMGKMFSYIRL
jgi:hypothetical protein